jgi:hypothetical protein
MAADWRVLAIAGTALIYVGNVCLNRAIDELERTRMAKTLDADTWTDAARNPTITGLRRRRRDDEAAKGDKPDAPDTGK